MIDQKAGESGPPPSASTSQEEEEEECGGGRALSVFTALYHPEARIEPDVLEESRHRGRLPVPGASLEKGKRKKEIPLSNYSLR